MSNAILEAANRIMHQDYPDDLTQEQRVAALDRDANLVAGDYELMWRDLAETNVLLAKAVAMLVDPRLWPEWRAKADAQAQANQRRLGLDRAGGDK